MLRVCQYSQLQQQAYKMSSTVFLVRDAIHKRAAYAVMRCLFVRPCVCLSRSWIMSKRINVSSSGSQAILVLPYRTAWQYSDGNPLTGRRMQVTEVGQAEVAILSQYLAFACCERCDSQLLSTRLSVDIWLSIDDCWSQCYQLTVVHPVVYQSLSFHTQNSSYSCPLATLTHLTGM